MDVYFFNTCINIQDNTPYISQTGCWWSFFRQLLVLQKILIWLWEHCSSLPESIKTVTTRQTWSTLPPFHHGELERRTDYTGSPFKQVVEKKQAHTEGERQRQEGVAESPRRWRSRSKTSGLRHRQTERRRNSGGGATAWTLFSWDNKKQRCTEIHFSESLQDSHGQDKHRLYTYLIHWDWDAQIKSMVLFFFYCSLHIWF